MDFQYHIRKEVKMANKNAAGSSVSTETSVYHTLKNMINTDTKVYYIMWKYCPEYLKDHEKNPIRTFDDLKRRYAVFGGKITEKTCEKYMLEEGVQNAVLWLLKRLHQKKQIELYNAYYQKALSGDVQAFKAFEDFSEKFFAENKENGLVSILNKVSETDLEDPENYSYEYKE